MTRRTRCSTCAACSTSSPRTPEREALDPRTRDLAHPELDDRRRALFDRRDSPVLRELLVQERAIPIELRPALDQIGLARDDHLRERGSPILPVTIDAKG